MANRRMFSKDIVCTDKFLLMNPLSQCLYYQWAMYADDDGFVSNSKIIQRAVGATEENAKELEKNNYVIIFKSGVLVITHWKMLNTIKSDRYTETVFKNEKAELTENPDKSYTRKQDVSNVETERKQDVSNVETQSSLVKDRVEKVKDTDCNSYELRACDIVYKKPNIQEVFNFYHEQKLDISPENFFKYNEVRNWIDKRTGQPIKDWKLAYLAMNEQATPDEQYNEDLTLNDCCFNFTYEEVFK